MAKNWKLATALLFTSAVPSSGCSWAFMAKPPHIVAVPNYPVDCTTSRAAPVLDTICSAYFVANGILVAALPNCENVRSGEPCAASSVKAGGIILSGGLALLCGFSAGSGFGGSARCQQVKDLNAGCMTGDLRACQQLRPGWVPASFTPPAAAPNLIGPIPPAAGPSQVPSTEPAQTGCTKDTDCKGVRICVSGACVDPPR